MPIQSTDTTTTITVANNGDTWIIAAGVNVATGPNDAIFDLKSSTTIMNIGNVVSANYAVYCATGTSSQVINDAGGALIGSTGIFLNGADDSAANHGSIYATEDGITAFATNISVFNYGTISSSRDGVLLDSSSIDGDILHNSGSIDAGAHGVLVHTQPSLTSDIVNSGVITGPASIADDPTFQGAADIDNSGTLDGKVDLEYAALACTIDNSGHIIGDVLLGAGADRYDGRGGAMSGIVSGGAGADTLMGGTGDETIDGGAGRDRLDGGKGGGEDMFRFDAVADSTANQPDLISKHWGPADTIDVNALDADRHAHGNQDFTFGGKVADATTALTPHEIQYYQANGNTYVVADTTGDGKADFEVVIHGTFTLTAAEFVL